MFTVEFDGPDFDDLKKNGLQRIIGDAMLATLERWARFEIKRRFTPRAAARYGWKARNRQYMIRKAKTKGHQDDMVFSGELKRMALAGLKSSISRRTLIVRVRFPVPDYAAIRRKSTGGVTLRQELMMMSAEETQAIREGLQAEVERRLKDPKYYVKRKRRIA